MREILQTVFKYKEKASPDKLGAYPERVHVGAMPERRYLWTSRFLVIFSCFSICFTMMLASTIFLLLPQRGAHPLLLQSNKYFSTLELTDVQERSMPVQDLIAELYIEEYIALRHVISNDYDELMTRWAPGSKLYWMSARRLFQSFASNDVENNVKKFRRSGLVRLVETEWVRPIAKGLWQAQFITLDFYPGQTTPMIDIWRAYIRAVFTNINYANRQQRELNPFGFLVLNYSLSYVGTPNEPVSYMNTAKDVRSQKYSF